jgi:hypothetical protein
LQPLLDARLWKRSWKRPLGTDFRMV